MGPALQASVEGGGGQTGSKGPPPPELQWAHGPNQIPPRSTPSTVKEWSWGVTIEGPRRRGAAVARAPHGPASRGHGGPRSPAAPPPPEPAFSIDCAPTPAMHASVGPGSALRWPPGTLRLLSTCRYTAGGGGGLLNVCWTNTNGLHGCSEVCRCPYLPSLDWPKCFGSRTFGSNLEPKAAEKSCSIWWGAKCCFYSVRVHSKCSGFHGK